MRSASQGPRAVSIYRLAAREATFALGCLAAREAAFTLGCLVLRASEEHQVLRPPAARAQGQGPTHQARSPRAPCVACRWFLHLCLAPAQPPSLFEWLQVYVPTAKWSSLSTWPKLLQVRRGLVLAASLALVARSRVFCAVMRCCRILVWISVDILMPLSPSGICRWDAILPFGEQGHPFGGRERDLAPQILSENMLVAFHGALSGVSPAWSESCTVMPHDSAT